MILGGPADLRASDFAVELSQQPAHAAGCRCCGGRDPLAVALGAAFTARARGTVPWFSRVLVVGPPSQAARVAAVLAGDPVSMARFKPMR